MTHCTRTNHRTPDTSRHSMFRTDIILVISSPPGRTPLTRLTFQTITIDNGHLILPPMAAQPVYRTCESSIGRLPTPRKERLRRWMLRHLIKSPLETISPPVLQGTEGHIVPKHLRYIGSYNWIDAPTPTIIVPGQSAISFAPRSPVQLCAPPLVVYRVPSDMGGAAHAAHRSSR